MPLNIYQSQDYKSFLAETLGERCSRNARYSLRAFGRDIETAPSFLSLLFRGKAELSLEKARVVADKLLLKDHERDYFVALVHKERSGDAEYVACLREKHAFTSLDIQTPIEAEFFLNDFALYLKLSLLGKVQKSDAKKLFGISEADLQDACTRLQTLGWIEGSLEGGWSTFKGNMRTETDNKSEAVRVFHQKLLDLATQQLHEGNASQRHFYSSFFSLKQKDYEKFCATLQEFCRVRTDAYDSREQHDTIYTLSFQVLPIGGLKRTTARSR
ncbi:MAG: TIGR02147 family protein [Chitinophagaceae bacterium]|nr:TIGR02147 family protein [Oligoflexus sp.]